MLVRASEQLKDELTGSSPQKHSTRTAATTPISSGSYLDYRENAVIPQRESWDSKRCQLAPCLVLAVSSTISKSSRGFSPYLSSE